MMALASLLVALAAAQAFAAAVVALGAIVVRCLR
jgi:hypothetical protein